MLLLNACGSDISEKHAVRRRARLEGVVVAAQAANQWPRPRRGQSVPFRLSAVEKHAGRTMAEGLSSCPVSVSGRTPSACEVRNRHETIG